MEKRTGTEVADTDNSRRCRIPRAVYVAALLLIIAVMIIIKVSAGKSGKVTYSVYPYLPDIAYYTEILEEEWETLHPDVSLEYVPYDCYHDGRPEEIDVIMFDSILEREFVEKGYIKPLDIDDFQGLNDFYEFTLEPADGYTEHYGIPVFLCCDLLIYDRDNPELSEADSIFDVAASDSDLLISFASFGDNILLLDAAADTTQDPAVIQYKERLKKVDVSANQKALTDAAIPEYTDMAANDLAGLYDSGIADGYIGYSETMRFLKKRIGQTEIKQISIDQNTNIPLFYCDLAGISADVPDDQTGLCLDLIGIMTDPAVMKRVSVHDGAPQYLMFPRLSFYEEMEKEYPIYTKLKMIAGNKNNRLFRTYDTFMEETYGN